MSVLLYGHKNCRGTCVRVGRNYSDLKNTDLNYRTSSLQLTNENDKALFFTSQSYRGDLIYRSGKKDINNLADVNDSDTTNFNNSIKSVRLTPFRMKVKYHFMWIDGDLPGDHSGLGGIGALVKQIKDMHSIVNDIWSEYFIDLEMDPIIGQYESSKYFEMSVDSPDELRELKNDSAFSFSNTCINVVLVEDVTSVDSSKNPTGKAHTGELLQPVCMVEVRPTNLLFTNARAIAHEIGHTFGLSHGSNSSRTRLMTQASQLGGNVGDAVELGRNEVETVHRILSDNDFIWQNLRLE